MVFEKPIVLFKGAKNAQIRQNLETHTAESQFYEFSINRFTAGKEIACKIKHFLEFSKF
jgi:hypothetical protein